MKINILASGSKGNAYLVRMTDVTLLLEAGIPFKALQKASGYNLSSVDACLITHEHKDHAYSVKEVIRSGIDVYMSEGTREALGLDNSHRLHTVKAHDKFQIGSVIVYPFEAVHDAKEPLSYLIIDAQANERLLFFTDTSQVKYRFSGVTHMLAECNYSKERILSSFDEQSINASLVSRIAGSHLSLESLVRYLEGSDLSALKEIYLIHLSDKNSDEEYMKTEVQKVTGALVVVA